MSSFQYRDPLLGVLYYIAEVRRTDMTVRCYCKVLNGSRKICLEEAIAEDTIAVAHDDDLLLIEDVVSPSKTLEFVLEVDH